MHRISSFATLRPPPHLKRPQLVSRAFRATVSRQLRGLTTEFCSTGMPSAWGAADRRAAVSGLSGALYALPATATPFLYEKALWLAQACLSILADYVFIAEDHPVQGVDRTFASFMMVRNLSVLGPAVPRLAPLVLVPVLCFVAAAHAKTADRPRAWQLAHGAWHLTGALLAWLCTARARSRGDDGVRVRF